MLQDNQIYKDFLNPVTLENIVYKLCNNNQQHFPICFRLDFMIEYSIIPFELGEIMGLSRIIGFFFKTQ